MPSTASFRRRSFVSSLLLVSLATVPATAQVASRVVAAVDDARRTTLAGHVLPAANAENDRGAVDGNEHVGQIMVMLSRTAQQQQDLDTLVDQMHNKQSPNFHKWLTPQQFGARFSPADSDVAAVTAWLQSKGLTVVEIPPSKTHITITGTVGQLRNAFNVDIHHLNINGEDHVATMTEPQVPVALAPVIGGLHKLDDIRPRPLYVKVGVTKRDARTGALTRVSGTTDPVGPNFTTTYNGATSYDLGPQDFYTVYNETPLLNAGINGAGVTIAVLEETQVNPADVTSFRAGFGLPTYPATPNNTAGGVNYIYGTSSGVGGDTACVAPDTVSVGDTDGDEGEADIDLQWAGTVAPNAIVDFVACGPELSYISSSNNNLGSSGIDHAAQHVVNYLSSTVTAASLSYGLCESQLNTTANAFYNSQWEQFAAEGITASVSSGDSGISACNNGSSYVTVNPQVNALGSTPYNISAGGTDFSDAYITAGYKAANSNVWWSATNGTGNSSALSYVPEMAWGGYCSNSLFSSILSYNGSTTFGSTYTPEAICNNSTAASSTYGLRAAAGGSGGVSTLYAAPTWQSVYGVGLYSGSSTKRTLPDISMFAASGFWGHALPFCESDDQPCVYSNSTDAAYLAAGGTSYVAPQIAGLMALINQKTNTRQGQADYTLYNLAAQEYGTPSSPNTANLASCSGSGQGASVGSSCIFRDIAADTPALQSGTNAALFITNGLIASNIVEPCKGKGSGTITDCYRTNTSDTYGLTTIPGAASSTYGYFVGAGYDIVTGLGSVNIANLVNNWTTVTPLFASATALATSGSSVTGATSVTLTATVTAPGRGGAVAPGGAVTFYIGSTSGTSLGTGTISPSCTGTGASTSCSGVASLVVPGNSLNVGSNSLIAYFPGDGANDGPSTSSAQTVSLAQGTTAQSITFPQPATPDPNGTILMLQATATSSLPVTYSILSGPATVSGTTVTLTGNGPVVIAADQKGNGTYAQAQEVTASVAGTGSFIWPVNATGTLTRLYQAGNPSVPSIGTAGASSPLGGVAIDGLSKVWSVTSGTNALQYSNNLGTASGSYSGGGLNAPAALAVDGLGLLWIANSGNGTVSVFSNAGAAISGTPAYGATASQAPSAAQGTPSAIAIDGTGGVWVTSQTGNSVTHIIGAAAPVVTPVAAAVPAGSLSTEP